MLPKKTLRVGVHPSMKNLNVAVETLENILGSQQGPDGRLLFTPQQVEELLRLRLSGGQPMLSLENKDGIYEILALFYKRPYDEILTYLESRDWPNTDEIAFLSPLMTDVINNVSKNLEIYRSQVISKGIFKCRKCGGTNTTTEQKQLRSADEGANTVVTCVTCQVSYTI